MNALYPLALEPDERSAIWGGTALAARYGKDAPAGALIGESWECYDRNTIRNGTFAGATLGDVRASLGRELMGEADATVAFPILTKFIDARAALSVQVHPGDAYARRVEAQPNGKTECWHVLEADPGAQIVLGWNRDTTREEYLERVRAGTLDDLLRRIPVAPGQTFHLPAGTLHAIGAGIVLFEAQQTSDLTYRIYDYDRKNPDGTSRELHVDRAADVLDYGESHAGPLRSLTYELGGLRRTALVADPRFTLERIDLPAERRGIDLDGMPLVVQALDTQLECETRGEALRLAPYESAVIPAGSDVVMVRTLATDGKRGSMLTAAPPHDREALDRRFGRAGVSVAHATDFRAQF